MAYTKEDLERRLAAMVKERGAQAPLVSETLHAQVRDAAKRNKALGDAAAYRRQKDDKKREPEKPTEKTAPRKKTTTKPKTVEQKRDPSKPHPLKRPNDPKTQPTKKTPEVIQKTEKRETPPAKRVSGNDWTDTPMWEMAFGTHHESSGTQWAKNRSTRKDGKVR